MTKHIGQVLLAWALLAAAAIAAEGPGKPGGPGGPGAGGPWQPGRPNIGGVPGYWMLGMENIQKELELVDEQKQKLLEIAEQYQAQMRQDWEEIRKLPPDEQRKRWSQQREKMTQRAAEVRKQVEQVLLPHQLDKLKELTFRMRAGSMLTSPGTIEQLKLSDDQKRKLQKIRQETMEKTQKLQQEALDESLGVLTEDQKAKLRDLSVQGAGF